MYEAVYANVSRLRRQETDTEKKNSIQNSGLRHSVELNSSRPTEMENSTSRISFSSIARFLMPMQ